MLVPQGILDLMEAKACKHRQQTSIKVIRYHNKMQITIQTLCKIWNSSNSPRTSSNTNKMHIKISRSRFQTSSKLNQVVQLNKLFSITKDSQTQTMVAHSHLSWNLQVQTTQIWLTRKIKWKRKTGCSARIRWPSKILERTWLMPRRKFLRLSEIRTVLLYPTLIGNKYRMILKLTWLLNHHLRIRNHEMLHLV